MGLSCVDTAKTLTKEGGGDSVNIEGNNQPCGRYQGEIMAYPMSLVYTHEFEMGVRVCMCT